MTVEFLDATDNSLAMTAAGRIIRPGCRVRLCGHQAGQCGVYVGYRTFAGMWAGCVRLDSGRDVPVFRNLDWEAEG